MELTKALQIQPGVTAVIGGGGKTTLLYALARELQSAGRVIVCTTTRILPPPHLPCVTGGGEAGLRDALAENPVVCAAETAENGKLKAPGVSFDALLSLADFILVEADGSKGLPMKAHAAHEPVIPPEANQTICVVGASGFGLPVSKAAHRPELYAARLGVTLQTMITPELAADFLNFERLHTRVLVNQCDAPQLQALARRFAARVESPVCIGALQKGWIECLY